MKLLYLGFTFALFTHCSSEGMFGRSEAKPKKVERFTATLVNNSGLDLTVKFIVARDAGTKNASPIALTIKSGERIPVPLTSDSNLDRHVYAGEVAEKVKKGEIEADAIYKIEYTYKGGERDIDAQQMGLVVFKTLDKCLSKNIEIEFGALSTGAGIFSVTPYVPWSVKCPSK